MRVFIYLASLAIILPSLALASSFDLSAVELDQLQQKAQSGQPVAQAQLASYYYHHDDIEEHYLKAAHWYKKAAANGHAQAQFRLGGMYYRGVGVDNDLNKAQYWWRKAAAQDVNNAQYMLYYLKDKQNSRLN